jgi:zinc protease
MRSIITIAFFVAIAPFAAFAQKPDSSKPADPKPTATPKLPEAKEIVELYVKAIGGREPLIKQKSRFQSATIELSPMGVKGTVESFSRSDDRLLIKTSLAGIGDILLGFDGQKGWTTNPIQGARVLDGRELLQTKRMAMFAREISFDKLYTSMRVRGVEPVGDRQAYVIVASTTGLPDDILYFDTETGLMLRSDTITVTPEGEQPSSSFYEDYRAIEGSKIPHKVRAKTSAFEILTVVTEVKYNVPIDDAKFVQPK